MIKCIAIDDEPLALRQLRTYIARVPFLELAGEYRNALEASRALEEQSVDLIFCDINMPDLSGIDFVRSLSAEQRPMIVFTTAYSEYAVEGFKLEAIDYLLKPFGFDEFNRAAQRAKSLSELIRSRREHPEETTESISLPQERRSDFSSGRTATEFFSASISLPLAFPPAILPERRSRSYTDFNASLRLLRKMISPIRNSTAFSLRFTS